MSMLIPTVPVELLTSRNLIDCAWAIKARGQNRQPLSPSGQVLYDWCVDNGITKLAPTGIWWGPSYDWVTAHRWLVYWQILDKSGSPSSLSENTQAVINWIQKPTELNQQICCSLTATSALKGDWTGYHLCQLTFDRVQFWYRSDRVVAGYRLLVAMNKYLPEPPL